MRVKKPTIPSPSMGEGQGEGEQSAPTSFTHGRPRTPIRCGPLPGQNVHPQGGTQQIPSPLMGEGQGEGEQGGQGAATPTLYH